MHHTCDGRIDHSLKNRLHIGVVNRCKLCTSCRPADIYIIYMYVLHLCSYSIFVDWCALLRKCDKESLDAMASIYRFRIVLKSLQTSRPSRAVPDNFPESEDIQTLENCCRTARRNVSGSMFVTSAVHAVRIILCGCRQDAPWYLLVKYLRLVWHFVFG